MSKLPMKRRKAIRKTDPAYPTADDVGRDRRRFLALVSKGLLGVSVLGLVRCDAGAGAPILKADGAVDVLESDEWVTGGIALPPDTVEDLVDGDWPPPGGITAPDVVEDVNDEDWNLAGAPRPPDTIDTLEDVVDQDYELGGLVAIDVKAPDTCTVKDVEGEFPPLLGDMPAPDVVTHEDTKDEDTDTFPPLDGDMPWPEEP